MKLTAWQAAIKVDWDCKRPKHSLRTITRLLRRAGYRPTAYTRNPSPSGNGWHVVLHVSPRPSSPFEVVALQLLLGGDVHREAMQLARARAFGDVPVWMRDKWNVLYLPHKHRQRNVNLPEFDRDDEVRKSHG